MGVNGKIKAIFLDRDGVLNKPVIINGKPYPPANINDLIIPNHLEKCLMELKKIGFLLIMITNQPDVSRGKTKIEDVEAINNYLKEKLNIDDVLCCYHDDNDNCDCRKPKPGMIFSAANKWKINLKKSFLIGDRWKDIESGKLARLKTFLIDYSYNEKVVEPDYRVDDFRPIVKIINNNL
jgi:D-glycero-D-manno-heptose 1,7-bisphosphate phosphatase